MKKTKFLFVFCVFFLFLTQTPIVFAEDELIPGQDKMVRLEEVIFFNVLQAAEGSKELVLGLETKDQFKIYEENLSFQYEGNGTLPYSLTAIPEPAAKNILDPFSHKNKNIFEHGTIFRFELLSPIKAEEKIVISVQACSSGVCLLPAKLMINVVTGQISKKYVSSFGESFSAPSSSQSGLQTENHLTDSHDDKEKSLTKEQLQNTSLPLQNLENNTVNEDKSTQTLVEKAQSFSSDISVKLRNLMEDKSFFVFPLLLLAGLLMNLTPCVYPMIPITLSVMNRFGVSTSREEKKLKRAKKFLPLYYVLGMVLTYSLLGVIAAFSGGIFGAQLGSPIFSFAVALIMVVLAFSMLDLFDLSRLQTWAHKIPLSNKSPFLAVTTMGAVSGLVSAPCTGPVLSMILVLIASTHNVLTGFVYMLFFSIGFGFPYIFLGVFAQKINKLPKLNHASVVIKFIFACLMLGLAGYFLKPIIGELSFFKILFTKPNFSDVLALLFLSLIILLIRTKKNHPYVTQFLKLCLIVGVSILCLWMTLFLSNSFVKASSQNQLNFTDMLSSSKIKWRMDLDKALQEAKSQNKNVVVDVWATWCAACLEMEGTTWQNTEVISLMNDKYVPVKLDFTNAVEETQNLVNNWGIVGLPAIVFLSSNKDSKQKPLSLSQGTVTNKKLISDLNQYTNP